MPVCQECIGLFAEAALAGIKEGRDIAMWQPSADQSLLQVAPCSQYFQPHYALRSLAMLACLPAVNASHVSSQPLHATCSIRCWKLMHRQLQSHSFVQLISMSKFLSEPVTETALSRPGTNSAS